MPHEVGWTGSLQMWLFPAVFSGCCDTNAVGFATWIPFFGFRARTNDEFHFVLGITSVDGQKCVILEKTEKGESHRLASRDLARADAGITLKIEGDGRYYSFGFSLEGGEVDWLGERVDASLLSTQVAGGFTGNVFGLYATTRK